MYFSVLTGHNPPLTFFSGGTKFIYKKGFGTQLTFFRIDSLPHRLLFTVRRIFRTWRPVSSSGRKWARYPVFWCPSRQSLGTKAYAECQRYSFLCYSLLCYSFCVILFRAVHFCVIHFWVVHFSAFICLIYVFYESTNGLCIGANLVVVEMSMRVRIIILKNIEKNPSS